MSEDIKIIHKVTMKLEQTLHQINKILSDHLRTKSSDKSNNSNQQRQNGDKKKESKKDKQHKKKRPLTPFFLFSKEQRSVIKENYPEMSVTQVGENLGKIWKNLSQEDKKPYFQKSKQAYQKFYTQNPEQRPKKSKN